MPLVTVVIPFYQRETGLLPAALRSIASQSLLVDGAAAREGAELGASADGPLVEVIVVDDGSPVAARDEIAAFAPPAGLEVRVIEQSNLGASAARNRALDGVRPGTVLLAFLDSDDVWSPDHLERAVRAHALGADLYSSNWIPVESDVDAFRHFAKLDPADHPAVPGLEDVHEFAGDFMAQELRGSIGRPSALVVRWERCGDLRFDLRLQHASEDQLWRLTLIAREPRVMFSTRPEVTSGRGVGLFSGARWGTERGLLVLVDRIRCMHLAARDLPLSEAARAVRRGIVESARLDLAAAYLHLLRAGSPPSAGALRRIVGSDPVLLALWPRYAWAAVRQRRRA